MAQNNYDFDVTAMGEVLIDFTSGGKNSEGQRIFAQNAGGAPANVLTQIQKFGGKTAFIGKVGNDMHGNFLKSVLEGQKINTDNLIVDENVFTTLAFVDIDENGERSFSFARKPGADTCLTKSEINYEIIEKSKIFHTGSLSLTDEPCRSAVYSAVEYAKKCGCIISYDPNYRASLWKDENTAKDYMRSLIEFSDLMKISDEETILLTDEKDAEKAAEKLFKKGVKIVAVTLGEKGCYVYCKDGGRFVPSEKVSTVADTTGAGDSFWGAFLFSIVNAKKDIENISLEDLCKFAYFANTAASICIGKKGAIPAMPDLETVNKRLSTI